MGMIRDWWTWHQEPKCNPDNPMAGGAKIKAEQALLGALLLNNEIFRRIEPILKAYHFSDPAHGRIFDLAARRINKNALASPVTLKPFLADDEELRKLGGTEYLARLAACSRDGGVTGNELAIMLTLQSEQPREKWRSREELAHSILLFVAKSDDAEILLGDLLEELAKVRGCKSDRFARGWFWWEIFWIVVTQVSARIRENPVIGRLLDACVERVKR